MGFPLSTQRLRVRHWSTADVDAALSTYGVADESGWLTPATHRLGDRSAMVSVLTQWTKTQPELAAPRGRWAIERLAGGEVLGGLAIRLLPPAREDLEVSFQLAPAHRGHGYAGEAAAALIGWALAQDGTDELLAVALPHNVHAIATMKRLGMEWVGETTKYYQRALWVYRIRRGEVTTPSDASEG